MVLFNRNLRSLAVEHGLDTLETARMLAMVHVSAADSLVGCWEAKFHYLFWRPLHAIQRADTDGNPDTVSGSDLDASRPGQPSGVSLRSRMLHVAVTRALTDLLRDRPRAVVDDEHGDGTTHSFDRLRQIRAEVTGARIDGGLHFRKSMVDGDDLARRTTRFVLRHNFGEAN